MVITVLHVYVILTPVLSGSLEIILLNFLNMFDYVGEGSDRI